MAAAQMSRAQAEALLRMQRTAQEAEEEHPRGESNRLAYASERAIAARQEENGSEDEERELDQGKGTKYLGRPLRELLPYEEYEEIPFTD